MHSITGACFSVLLFFLSAGITAEDAQRSDGAAVEASKPSSTLGLPQTEAGSLRFNFQNAQWPDVAKWIADQAGLTLDLTDTPPGEFNYVNNREHSVPEALDALNGYLLPRGYVLLRRDKFLVVLKTDNPMLPNLIPTVPASTLDRYGDNELVRIVVPVEGLEPAKVAEQLAKILGPHGTAAPLDASDSLILQGFGKSLRETVALLSSAVVPPADDELVFRSFPLQHIPAADAERQIQNLFGLASNPFRASMARRDEYYRRRSDRDDDDNRRAAPTPLVQNIAMNMKVSALRHTNSLLITATPAAISLVENILESIDVRPPGGDAALFTDNTPVLRVYIVDEADEDDVAETIDAVLPGVVINEDGRHDSIHVFATPAEHQEVEKLINIIDGGGVGGGVEIVPLMRSDPYEMSGLLSSLFENEDRDDRPVITPEYRNNSLIIRASAGQMAEIKKTLAAFGERADAIRPAQSGGRFRKLTLSKPRDAERIARTVEELLRDDSHFDNPIRVVVPSAGPTTRSPNDADGPKRTDINTAPDRTPSTVARENEVRATEQDTLLDTTLVKAVFFADQLDENDTPNDDDDSQRESRSDRGSAPRVTIEVRGGELFLYSNDDVALDEVEETIRELVRQMPSRTEWTIFYLRAAPAEGTAQTLVELLRNNTYPSAVVGAGIDETGIGGIGPQSMRIVPDARTNALFVSGPESQVEQAERFLRYLDTTELPESLRDRVPRAIPVEYASVSAVAEMVRELYKDFMEDPNARRRESQRNDRDRNQGEEDSRERELVTAARSQNPGLRPTGIQLTLAVDVAANTLLVSCNEHLFQQIRNLVEERDQAAYESRPVISVIRVNDPNVSGLKAALDGVLPRVTVSTTPSSPARSVPEPAVPQPPASSPEPSREFRRERD